MGDAVGRDAAGTSGYAMEIVGTPGKVAYIYTWAQALAALGSGELDETSVRRTLGSILKYREDIERISDGDLVGLVEEARRRG